MKVKFVPMDKELEIKPGQSVMTLAHENGINILSVCNGMPSCAECRVKVVENDHNVLPPSSKELSLIGTGYFLDQRRLSCQLLCFGDITVDVTEQIDKANEAKVNKKFLKRAQKANAEDSHALNGILIEQDQEILNEISKESENRRSGRERGPRDENRNNHRSRNSSNGGEGDLLNEMQAGEGQAGQQTGSRDDNRPSGGGNCEHRQRGGGGNREGRQGGGGGGNRGGRGRRRRR